jgi:hypothetical protein
MTLVDMKLTKAEKKESSSAGCVPAKYDGPDYPWGLTLRLDDAALKKLGTKELPEVDSEFSVVAVATVKEVRSSSSKEHSDRCVELQIMKLDVSPAKKEPSIEDTARTEYKRLNGKGK